MTELHQSSDHTKWVPAVSCISFPGVCTPTQRMHCESSVTLCTVQEGPA